MYLLGRCVVSGRGNGKHVVKVAHTHTQQCIYDIMYHACHVSSKSMALMARAPLTTTKTKQNKNDEKKTMVRRQSINEFEWKTID